MQKKYLYLALFGALCHHLWSAPSAEAQYGSSIPGAPSRQEMYGINAPSTGDSSAGGAAELTRHHRMGDTTGIGSSTFQTESSTAESSPLMPRDPLRTTVPQLTPASPFAREQRSAVENFIQYAGQPTFRQMLAAPEFESLSEGQELFGPGAGTGLNSSFGSGFGAGFIKGPKPVGFTKMRESFSEFGSGPSPLGP